MWSRRSAASLRFAPEPSLRSAALIGVQAALGLAAVAVSGLDLAAKLALALVLLVLAALSARRSARAQPALRWRSGLGWALGDAPVRPCPPPVVRQYRDAVLCLGLEGTGRRGDRCLLPGDLSPRAARRLRTALRWYPAVPAAGEPSAPGAVHPVAEGAAGPGRGGPDGRKE